MAAAHDDGNAVGEGLHPLPLSPETVIASHAEGVARRAEIINVIARGDARSISSRGNLKIE